MNNYVPFRGPVTELMTYFLDDGQLDDAGLAKMVEYQLESGIHGFFLNGLVSECLLMNHEERAHQVALVKKLTDGKAPVFANITTCCLRDSLNLLRCYEDAGADGIFITQTPLYKYTEAAMEEYFSAICAGTTLPVHIFNAPSTQNLMSAELVARLANTIDNITGYKDSTSDIVHTIRVMDLVKKDSSQFDYEAGSDGTILPILQLGGTGCVSLLSLVFPRLVIDVCEAHQAGNQELAISLQKKIVAVRKALKRGGHRAGYMYAGELTGHPITGTRFPKSQIALTDQQKTAIETDLKELEMI